MHNSRTTFYIFGCLFTRQWYCEEVILDRIGFFRDTEGTDFLFMYDNARPRRNIKVSDTLDIENIKRMEWPAYSSDFIPIEITWDALDKSFFSKMFKN